MRYISLVVSIVLFIFLISGCGEEDEESPPTTGSVSGMITFIGAPPQGMGEIQVSIFVSIFSTVDANGRPTGPPDHYCEAFEEFTGEVPYKISGVSFGTYKLAAVGYEAPDSPPGTPQTILGMYGFAPPGDMQPDSFAVSEDQPDVTGIDIIADYAMISN